MSLFKMLRKDRTVRVAFIITIIIWLLLAFMNVFGFFRYYEIYQSERLNDTVHVISPLLEDYGDDLNLFKTYVSELEGEVSEDNFSIFAEEMFGENETINYVTIAPLGIIENVYPESCCPELDGVDLLNQLTIEEFSRFSASINDHDYFITYIKEDETVKEMILHHPIQDGDEFLAVVSISIDVDKFLSSIPEEYITNEIAVLTEDHEFIFGSEYYLEDEFRTRNIDIEGYDFTIGIDDNGSYYTRTIVMLFLATFLLTTPLIIIFVIFYIDQKKTRDFLDEIEYSRTYSLDTGLKNTNSFYKDIDTLIKKEEKFFLALGVFNNIKYINDKYGHRMGTELILEAVTLIKGVIRAHTELYHLGGDEYVFIIRTERKPEVNNILKRVLKVFDRDIVIDRIRTNISMTMGVVAFPRQGRTIDELIKNAHLTLSNSHISNTNAFAFYKKDAISNLLVNRDFDNFVKKMNLELFEVYLMPIVDVASNLIVGFECLTRAFNEFDEMIDTESVINSLERNGRIQELDEIVFKKMLRMMRRINKEFPDNEYFLSVNASALSFNESYVNNVIELYEKEHFTKGTIVLELTESYKVEDYDYLIRLFKRLNGIGIKTAIDDFGSGYSSLSYISKFPIYAIKVDKEYVRDYHENSFNRTLFMTLRSIAEVLDCKLVAEGVDDPETLEFLRSNRCELYQGFLFSKGVTFEQGLKMIEKNVRQYGNLEEE